MKRNIILFVVLMCVCLSGYAREKVVYIPEGSMKSNKFNQPDGGFGDGYKAESENLVIFWDKSFGKDPTLYHDKDRRFYPDEILKEGERFYKFYADHCNFIKKGKSNTDKYKMIIWMYNDDETTAYGGADGPVGMMWFRPCRINSYPYCALAHELGHSFQYMVGADGMRGFNSSFGEYTSQWMLWQVYSDWTTIEKYHLDAFMKQTHYAAFHVDNCYHAPQLMEYWSEKHGTDIIGSIWRKAEGEEDVIAVYKRLTGISQEAFNDEVYDAASRFVTWDLPRIRTVCSSYANEHICKVDRTGEGSYRISKGNCPQNYGYNAIRLSVPEGGAELTFEFEGIVGDKDFRAVNAADAGWRYGFVAMKKNGKRVYGKMNVGVNGKNAPVSFEVPEDTQFLWLVVTGAPTVHRDKQKGWKQQREEIGKEPQWPYRFRLTGAKVM